MNPSEGCSGLDGNYSEIAYITEGDAAEIIDIDAEDNAANELDDLELGEGVEEMDEDGASVQQDDALCVFRKHTNAVLCVCVDPMTSTLAVSGGQDDFAYVWSLSDGSVIQECIGHKDSVHCVAFSYDSSLIATGDMVGVIKVWNNKSHEEIFSYALSVEEGDNNEDGSKEDLLWLEWHGSKNDLLAGTKAGDVYMWMNVLSSADFHIFSGHGCPCTVGRFLHDGQHACCGYEDGTIKCWNLPSGKCVHTFMGGKIGHASQVTCIDCHRNNNIVVTGSTDSTALLLNIRSGKVLTKFVCGDTSRGDSVEAAAFSSCGRYIATATISHQDTADASDFGMLTFWETEKFVQRHQCRQESGITRLCWDVKEPMVYTASEDGSVSSWDARNGTLLSTWRGHTDIILDLNLSRDGKTLVTASDDHTARVFSLQNANASSR